MKNDSSFKIVAAIIFVGVLVALVAPSHVNGYTAQASPASVQTVHHAE